MKGVTGDHQEKSAGESVSTNTPVKGVTQLSRLGNARHLVSTNTPVKGVTLTVDELDELDVFQLTRP